MCSVVTACDRDNMDERDLNMALSLRGLFKKEFRICLIFNF